MGLQFSTTVRNARLDAIEVAIGAAPILKIRTGAQPANAAAADTGTVLATMTLPSDWLAAAASGAKSKSGTWEDTSADATGTAAHYRIYDSGGSTCHIQGSVSASGGGGELELQQATADIVSGQKVTVSTYTLTDANS